MKITLLFLSVLFIFKEIKTDQLNDSQNSSLSNQSNNNGTSFVVPTKPVSNIPIPEALIVLPIRRTGTAEASLNVSPCGGIVKKKTNTLANSQSLINMIWEIRVPAQDANCTVKISPGLENETNFKTIFPVDGSADKIGQFPCGRTQGFDSKQFKLPDNYVCDQCTLQWKWITNFGDFYSCSDITINGMMIENCMSRCNNGGACFNGKCICTDKFYGEYCENAFSDGSGIEWIILILILLIILISGAIYILTRNKDSLVANRPFSAGLENNFNENNKAEPIVIKQK